MSQGLYLREEFLALLLFYKLICCYIVTFSATLVHSLQRSVLSASLYDGTVDILLCYFNIFGLRSALYFNYSGSHLL